METNLEHYRQEIIKAMSSSENYIDVLNEKFGFIKKTYRNERLTKYEKNVRFVDFCLEEYQPRFEITKLEKTILENVTGTTITKHGFEVVLEGYQYNEEEDENGKVVTEKTRYALNDLTEYFENAYFDGLKNDKTYFIDEILENYEVIELD